MEHSRTRTTRKLKQNTPTEEEQQRRTRGTCTQEKHINKNTKHMKNQNNTT